MYRAPCVAGIIAQRGSCHVGTTTSRRLWAHFVTIVQGLSIAIPCQLRRYANSTVHKMSTHEHGIHEQEVYRATLASVNANCRTAEVYMGLMRMNASNVYWLKLEFEIIIRNSDKNV